MSHLSALALALVPPHYGCVIARGEASAAGPIVEQATEAAVAFGQDDDVTVLTLTRLAAIA